MKNWKEIVKFIVGFLVVYNGIVRNSKRRVQPTTPTISSKPMQPIANNGGL